MYRMRRCIVWENVSHTSNPCLLIWMQTANMGAHCYSSPTSCFWAATHSFVLNHQPHYFGSVCFVFVLGTRTTDWTNTGLVNKDTPMVVLGQDLLEILDSHTATHCDTMPHTATHCNILHHTATNCDSLQHTATHCNPLQLTATHCITLRHTTTHCDILQHRVSSQGCTDGGNRAGFAWDSWFSL